MNSFIKIYNAHILTPQGILKDGIILIENDQIVEIGQQNLEVNNVTEIDARGKFISPGFIDMHIHGGGGHDFMDNSVEAFLEIARIHAKHGTTAMMPTTLSCENEDLLATLATYENAHEANTGGAQFLGIHIEGPYFAMTQKGAQDARYIRVPNPAEYKEIVASSRHIKRWSAAPELPGALTFGRFLTENNIIPAIAHTDAIYEDVVEAFEAGYTHVTHFYSCMSGVSRRNALRYAGVIEAAYLIDGMTVEIIADGVHLPAPLLKLIYKIKGVDNIALTTDAMRAAGESVDKSVLGSFKNGTNVIIEDGVAKLTDRSAFAGSVATMDRLVRNMVNLAEIPLTEAIKMASAVPAKILGIHHQRGTLEKGKKADLVIFNNEIEVSQTIVNGKIIFSTEQEQIAEANI